MRYVVLVCLALLVPCALRATACNSNCTFIRGDANCSGAVNSDDASALYYSTYTNSDAADVNDDGVVNGADLTRLYNYLTYGSYYAPACPFPTAGIDSTGDGLENCCSPPSTKVSPIHTGCDCDVTNDVSFPWDDTYETEGTEGDLCWGYGLVENWGGDEPDGGCEHAEARADLDLISTALDQSGFTKKRLYNGVQKAWLRLEVEAWLTEGERGLCTDQPCNFTNQLLVEIAPEDLLVAIHWVPAAGGTGGSVIYEDYDDLMLKTYSTMYSGQNCIVNSPNETHQGISFNPVDISTLLGGGVPNDCTIYEIDEVAVFFLSMDFIKVNVGGQVRDIVETEQIEVDVQCWVDYTWDTCP